MKQFLRKQFLLLVGLFIASLAIGQMTVSGKVVDQKNEPLIGVNILIKNTATGAVTDFDGNYTLTANTGDTLVFSYTGFKTTEVGVGVDNNISITLEEGSVLDEVVVVAYGTQRKVTVTGAVAQIDGGVVTRSPAVDMSNSLAGRLPGLVVIQPSGEPGYDGARINIRGINTLGNSSPLIVIDGIPDRDGGLGRLNPQDVESISVLKDASAAIYGARAANGAILITTRRGKTGKPTVSYSFNQGWSQPTRTPEMSNAVEYANIMNELPIYKSIPVNEWSQAWSAIQTSGTYDSPTAGVGTINANYSPEAVRKHGDGSDPWGYPDTDWFADAFNTWSPQSRHNLQVNGGTENIKYFGSLGYLDQDAYYKNTATYYKQYDVRMNLDAKINKYINTNLGVLVRREDRNFPTESAGSIFRMLMRGRPTEPEVWPNGLPGPDIENGQNPYVITTNATGYVKNPKDYTQINGGVSIGNPWIAGLKINLSGAIDKNNETNKSWQTPWKLYYWDRTSRDANGDPLLVPAVRSNFTDPRLNQSSRSVLNTNLSANASYDTKINDQSSFNALLGVTKETFTGENFNAFRRNYISSAIDQIFARGQCSAEHRR